MKWEYFPESAWAFHRVPEDELQCCYWWELDIEAGSGRGHWLDLPEKGRRKIVDGIRRREAGLVMEEWPIHRVRERDLDWMKAMPNPVELHVLQINWSKGKTELKDHLKMWFKAAYAERCERSNPRKGGGHGPYSPLIDLAVYRAAVRGRKPSPGYEEMERLFRKSSSNWRKPPGSLWTNAEKRGAKAVAELWLPVARLGAQRAVRPPKKRRTPSRARKLSPNWGWNTSPN